MGQVVGTTSELAYRFLFSTGLPFRAELREKKKKKKNRPRDAQSTESYQVPLPPSPGPGCGTEFRKAELEGYLPSKSGLRV